MKKIFFLTISISAFYLLPNFILANGNHNGMMGNMMNWDSWGFGAGWVWLGWVFMILFWILIIVGIIALIRQLIAPGRDKAEGKSALEILKERYAEGEINKDEFEEKKKGLI